MKKLYKKTEPVSALTFTANQVTQIHNFAPPPYPTLWLYDTSYFSGVTLKHRHPMELPMELPVTPLMEKLFHFNSQTEKIP